MQCNYLPGMKIYFRITADDEEWEIYAYKCLTQVLTMLFEMLHLQVTLSLIVHVLYMVPLQ